VRVKLKSLAAEARIIRKEELRTFGQLREELYRHRMDVVRVEARATHIAYGLMRGRTLEKMSDPNPPVAIIAKASVMYGKYGPKGEQHPEFAKRL
jgi:hypothetical protein